MFNNLTIENFKSIKNLSINCRRINLFMGEPNVGKSNILESLGFLSYFYRPSNVARLKDFIRFEHTQYLYYDIVIENPIKINLSGEKDIALEVIYENNSFKVNYNNETNPIVSLDYDGNWISSKGGLKEKIQYYKFSNFEKIDSPEVAPLLTPDGKNLFMTAYASQEHWEIIANLFIPTGLQAVLKPHEKIIELQKHVGNIAISYPFVMMSDTMQRIIFYLLAIRSNKDSVLVFEEPESHAFPYYTKFLGEMIAADTSNQYFIATHNPYLLNAIIEKADKNDVNVCVTYYKDYQTKIRQLSQNELELLLDQDPFLSLNQFVGD